jgi:tetratricopeptide (TPR) repeat protein
MTSETITIRGRPGEQDFFYTLDRVLQAVVQLLGQARIDEAVDIYMRCREDVGFQLIGKAQGDPTLFQQVANLFYRARDYQRAAYCCEQLDEPAKAAALYERCDDFAAAANMYAAAGDKLKAAEMFEKTSAWVDAARLYQDGGDPLRAASAYERGGRRFEAGRLYLQAGKPERAVHLLQALEPGDPDKAAADAMLKEILATRREAQPQAPGPLTMREMPAVSVTAAAPAPVVVTVMEGFDLLKRLPLFEELSLGELKELYHLCVVADLPPRAPLIMAGVPAEALFVLLDGSVEVRNPGDPQPLAKLGAGAFVGEMSLIDDGPASADVVTTTTTRVLRLERDGFRRVLGTQEHTANRIYKVFLKVLVERLRETTSKLAR